MMDFNGGGNTGPRLAIAITPTKDRHQFLIRQMDAFWNPYLTYKSINPGVPDLKWIIVDESSQPCPAFADKKIPGIIYLHVPNRDNLSTLPEEYRGLCEECLFSSEAVNQHVADLNQNPNSNRFIVAHDPWLPSIGEMRSIGIAVARQEYLGLDPNAVVLAKDDDDFSSPDMVNPIYKILQNSTFAKIGNMHVHDAHSREWYNYSYGQQDEIAYILQDGVETRRVYTTWENKDETVENPYKGAGIYGMCFTYRLNDACQLGDLNKEKFGKFSPFRPLSRREDIAFFADVIENFGEGSIKILDNPKSWVTRVIHNNTTRTIHNGTVSLSSVAPFAKEGVEVLCGLRTDTPSVQTLLAPIYQPVVPLFPLVKSTQTPLPWQPPQLLAGQ